MSSMNNSIVARYFGLSGLTAVVTGAGSGLGRQAARTLAAAGAQVALLGRRADPLTETEEMIVRDGGVARHFPVDVTDQEAVGLAFDEIQRTMAPLWALVNNAGAGGRAALIDVDAQLFDRAFGVNTKAAVLTATAFARRLVASALPGRIINICSLARCAIALAESVDLWREQGGARASDPIDGSRMGVSRHQCQRDQSWLHRD